MEEDLEVVLVPEEALLLDGSAQRNLLQSNPPDRREGGGEAITIVDGGAHQIHTLYVY